MNTDHLVEYLSALEPNDPTAHQFYWSGIHPDGRRIQAYGTVEDMLPRLQERNGEGYGIYICANAIDTPSYEGGFPRRRATDVSRVRAVFADWDDAKRVPPDEWPLPPSMIVRTSKGKYHIYWLVNDFPLDQFERAQRGIAKTLGTDPSVIDLSREMRVPGFMHTKGKPTIVSLLENHGHRYGVDEILGAFPYKDNVTKLPVKWEGTPRTITAQTAAVVAHRFPRRADGGYNIPCPWEAQHTTPSTASSTVYYPPDAQYGAGGYFDCKHAHCRERTASELDAWIAAKVASALW